jgi:hypothetical protein
MASTPSACAVRRLVVIALVATTLAPLGRQTTGTITIPDQMRREQIVPAPAPLVLAQGRCFNGRCF